VGVRLIRRVCVCGIRGPLCCGAVAQGLCNAPHDSGTCWKQFMMCNKDTWFVAAFRSTPMHNPGLKEVQRPARVCVCRGASVQPCLLSCAVRRSRLRAAPPPDACPPESPWCRRGSHEGFANGEGGHDYELVPPGAVLRQVCPLGEHRQKAEVAQVALKRPAVGHLLATGDAGLSDPGEHEALGEAVHGHARHVPCQEQRATREVVTCSARARRPRCASEGSRK